jgi:glycerate 2-kinase
MDNRIKAERIYVSGVRSVMPEKLISRNMSVEGSVLKIGDLNFSLEDIRKIYVIGAGKASAAMGHYVENILGNRITEGHIVVKYKYSCKLRKIKVTEAGHPIPDLSGIRATKDILRIARQATENDLVICLISGGGSALMADLPEGCLPEELIIVNNLLIRSGASINEINTVRKHLSEVKGGQLVRAIWPAASVSLILSDVIGNPLDVIASGPTVPDSTTFGEALKILSDYQLTNYITASVLNYLKEGESGIRPETPKPGDPLFTKTFNILAGTNLIALEAAKETAIDLDYNTFIIESEMWGDVGYLGQCIVDTALTYKNNNEIKKPVCLLYGGEPTIKVSGEGLGGRNQHLALSAAIKLQNKPGITILSAGTDGTDGPTKAAGAVVDSDTVPLALSINADPEKYLSEFDSFNFFRVTGGQIITGPTFTNVMDLVVVIVE